MGNLVRELRFSARRLAGKPGFTAVAVLTLGIAIGGCTAIYSVVHGVLLRPLPYPEPDRLVQVWQENREGGRGQFSDPNFEDLRDQSRAFEAFAQYADGIAPVLVGDRPQRIRRAHVSARFFDVFRPEPARGRVFVPEEHRPGAPPVAVVSHRFWRRELGGATDLSAVSLRMDDRTWTVVGVLPPEHDFPADTAVWIPREPLGRNPNRTGHNWRAVARLADGMSLTTAREDVTAVARRLERELGEETWMTGVALVPLREEIAGAARRPLLVLLASVGVLLVLACANLASLLLVHAASRQREMAVRAALGASRSRLTAPLAAEAVLISLAGGLVGIVLGAVALRAGLAFEPGSLPRLDEVGLSAPVVLTVLGVTVLVMLALGAAASAFALRPDLTEGLKQGRGQTASRATARLRTGLVVAQLALSLMLLIGAGLLGRSLALLLAEDPGFRTERVLTAELQSPPADDAEALGRRVGLYDRLLDRLSTLPGVDSAGGVNALPMGSGYSNGTFVYGVPADAMDSFEEVVKLARDPERSGWAEFRIADRGYFETLGIPLVRGRLFESRDVHDAPHVAVISESLARSAWGDADPLGAHVQFGGMDGDLRVFTVVGVVGDIRERGLDSEPLPTFYADYRQRPVQAGTFTLVLRTEGASEPLVGSARAAIRELAPNLAPRFRSIEQVVSTSVANRRFSLLVLSAFAATAWVLAVLGIYGVVAYSVARRRPELGLRLVLGARRSEVWGLVLRQAAVVVALGVGIGVAGALTLSRVLESMLYGVTATDVPTFVGVAVALAGTALVACQIPALRATRVDPVETLQAE